MEENKFERMAREADFRARVNEKLVKALIAFLAVKDEHLLDELRFIFDRARRQGEEIGRASPEV